MSTLRENLRAAAAHNAHVHVSVSRLLDEAKRATAHLPLSKRINSMADLRRAMDVSAQTLGNWKTRGISVEGALRAEILFGVPASGLLSMAVGAAESAPAWLHQQHPDAGAATGGPALAHPVSLLAADSTPLITWEALMQADAQTSAATHPSNVQPSKRFSTEMAMRL
jgi:hypothetical protein